LIRVFGITGTNGKTTASWMLRNILQQKGPCALVGTINYIIGDESYVPENTTPGKARIRALLSEMTERRVNACVMEVSSHGIDQGRTDDVIFEGVGFTNLSRDHLDYHGSMEQYYLTKKKLFLNKTAFKTIFLDDEYGSRMYEELRAEENYAGNVIKGCSLTMRDADFYGKILTMGISGTRMEFYEDNICRGTLEVRLPGTHFAADALVAAAMARQAGCPFEDIRKGIASVKCIAGRMELIGSEDDTLGVVDYAHTPDGLEKLLLTLSEYCRNRLICVFGCGGFRDRSKRSVMGRVAGTYSDYCVITNDNPRGEPPENIAQAIEEGVHETGCGYEIILDRRQAIKRAVSLADKWDIIVVAGKGHETYQISENGCVPFDDRKVLKEFLEKKYEKTYDEGNRDRYVGPFDFRK